MMRATAMDGEFHVHVACGRSSRLSHTLSSTGPDPLPEPSLVPEEVSSSEDGDVSEGAVTSEEVADSSDLEDCLLDSTPLLHLSPIPEELGLSDASISPIFSSSTQPPATAVLLCHDAIVAGGHPAVSSLASPSLGAGVGVRDAEVGEASRDAFGAVDGLLVVDGDRGGVDLAVGHGVGHTALCSAGSYGDDSGAVPLAGGGVVQGSGGVLSINDAGEAFSQSVVPEVAQIPAKGANGVEQSMRPSDATENPGDFMVWAPSQLRVEGDGGEQGAGNATVLNILPALVGSYAPVSGPDCDPHVFGGPVVLGDSPCYPDEEKLSPSLAPLVVADMCRIGGGGMVREEGRAPPVAKEAVRPQPADGLRQLPRSSEESLPVSEAETAAGAARGGF
ncbi:hypothetical protein Dimus_037053 [Dionaea muscipula]